MSTFADRVRSERKAKGLTQVGLAKKSGVSQATIADIERGRNHGSTELVGIAKALHVNPGWLKTGSGDKEIGSAQTSIPVTLLPEAIFSEAAQLLAEMDEYDADVWITKLKCSAEVQRAETRAASNKVRRQQEDRESHHDPTINKRRASR